MLHNASVQFAFFRLKSFDLSASDSFKMESADGKKLITA